MKKKFIACIGMMGLALTGLFVTPVKSNAAESTEPTTRTVSDTDIENYISGQYENPGDEYFLYKVFTHYAIEDIYEGPDLYHLYGTVSKEPYSESSFIDEQYDTLGALQFYKDHVYVINGYYMGGDVFEHDNPEKFCYGTSLFYYCDTTITDIEEKSFFTHNFGEELDFYNDPQNEIETKIYENWQNVTTKILNQSIFSIGDYGDILVETHNFGILGQNYIIIPKEDFILEANSEKIKNQWDCFSIVDLKLNWNRPDYVAPVIGGTVNLSVNVDNQPSLEEILSHVQAVDETDGIVPIKVTSSTYTPGEMKVGEYYINLSATDVAGNTGTGVITLYRFDSTSPSIDGQDSYVLNYDHDITLQKILNNLTTSDNVDENLPLEVVSDTFTGNEHVLGNYQVVVRTKDLSDNYSANKTVNLTIQNQGTSVITAPKEITVPISSPLTLEAFKSHISVYDGYDGEITNYTINGFDEYTRTERTVGYNPVTISYTNSGNNTASATIQLKKVDDILPTIKFDSGCFVILAPGETFSMDQFKVHAAKVLKINVDDIVDVKGEYDTSKEGEYIMTLSLADETTQEFTVFVGSMGTKTSKFKFTDLFTKFYWVTTWNDFKSNLFKASKWNWMNYTALVLLIGGIVGLFFGYRQYKKKKKGK